MALEYDPQYKLLEAIKRALEDTRSEIGLTWRIQKLGSHNAGEWEAGAYLCPLPRSGPAGYENVNDRVTVRTLAAIIRPGEQDLTTNMQTEMQKIWRVENIFRNCGLKQAPASIVALNSLSPDPLWRYQITRLESADQFVASAFRNGFDACATVMATEFIVHRSSFDFTLLGNGDADP